MSTDFLGVRLLEIDRPARRVRMRVFVVYYADPGGGHEPLPYDASVFARILWDAGKSKGRGKAGMVAAAPLERWLDEGWVDANAWRFIARFEQLSTRNTPMLDPAGFDPCYYERKGRWADEEKLVQGDYDVWLTEERWLAGLVVGASFGTTSYNTQADAGDLARVDRLPEPQRALATFALAERPKGQESLSARPVLLTASDDGRWLACGDEKGRLQVIDTHAWMVCHDSMKHGAEELACAEFVRGEPTLLLPKNRALTLPDGTVKARQHGLTRNAPLRCGGSGRVRVVRTDDDGLVGWSVVRDGEVLFASDVNLEGPCWALAGDDRTFAVFDTGPVELWDVAARTLTRRIETKRIATAAAFSPDGTLLLLGRWWDDSKGFCVYEVATGREVRRVVGRDSRPLEDRAWGDGKPSVTLALWTARYVALAEEFVTSGGETRGATVRAFECGPPPPFAEPAPTRAKAPRK